MRGLFCLCWVVLAIVGEAYAGGSSAAPIASKSSLIEIEAGRICLYGKWQEGEIELELRGDAVFVNGVQIFPPVGSQEAVPVGVYEMSDKERMTQRCYGMQVELWAQGLEKEDVVGECIAFLVSSQLVLDVEDHGGDTYKIRWSDGDSVFVNIGHSGHKTHREVRRDDRAQVNAGPAYDKFGEWFRAGDLVIVSQHNMLRVPATNVDNEVLWAEVQRARSAAKAITSDEWGAYMYITPSMAELIRNPVSQERVGGDNDE